MGQSLRRPRHPLDQLAQVEIQLIMHGLDLLSLIRFSRCNRSLMTAATVDSFGWKYVTVPIQSSIIPYLASSSIPLPHLSPLLRHVFISFYMDSKFDRMLVRRQKEFSGNVDEIESLLAVAATGRLVEIHATHRTEYDGADWNSILANDNVKGNLHVVDLCMCGSFSLFSSSFDLSFMKLLANLPLLTTLRMPDPLTSIQIDAQIWSLLPTFPCLTELQMMKLKETIVPYSFIAQCNKLQRLHISFMRMRGDRFKEFCSSPSLSQLRFLTFKFDLNNGNDAPDVDFITTCFLLPQLQSLRLLCVADIPDLQLKLIRCPPPNRRLIVEIDSIDSIMQIWATKIK